MISFLECRRREKLERRMESVMMARSRREGEDRNRDQKVPRHIKNQRGGLLRKTENGPAAVVFRTVKKGERKRCKQQARGPGAICPRGRVFQRFNRRRLIR